ncbi:hypothetical protein [Aerosakkonema funiforme]|uniref:hypothetical protein n=1 Tax=Aerosakkonema funiforme TaxID=1246630 RepID=UPI0035B93B67
MKQQLTGQQIAEILNETRYENSSDWVFVKSKYSSDYVVLSNEQFCPNAPSRIDIELAELLVQQKLARLNEGGFRGTR